MNYSSGISMIVYGSVKKISFTFEILTSKDSISSLFQQYLDLEELVFSLMKEMPYIQLHPYKKSKEIKKVTCNSFYPHMATKLNKW